MKTLGIFLYVHREAMDLKLRKQHDLMQDCPHNLLTWAKYFNDIAILYHSQVNEDTSQVTLPLASKGWRVSGAS